jgi:hypothetical protein
MNRLDIINRPSGFGINYAAVFFPISLFSAGEQGVWYDPSSITETKYGPELVTNGGFDGGGAGWELPFPTRADYTFAGGTARITNDHSNGSTSGFGTMTQAEELVSGKTYFVEINLLTANNLTQFGSCQFAGGGGFSNPVALSVGANSFMWQPTGTMVSFGVRAATATDGAFAEFDNISVREVLMDTVTMFQDSAGATPAVVGQPVGLMLDKSQGLVRGSELVVDGAYTLSAGITESAGLVSFSGSQAINSTAAQNVLVSGQTYEITFTVSSYTQGQLSLTAGTSPAHGGKISSVGTYTRIIVGAGSTAFNFQDRDTAVTPLICSIDNVSVKLIPGNHATQATTASKPILARNPVGGRRNLVIYSQNFSDAGWGATSATKTYGVLDPDGGTTATTVTATAANGSILRSFGGSLGTGVTYTNSIWVKRRTGTGGVFFFTPNAGGATIAVTDSWQRITISSPGPASTLFIGLRLATLGDAVDIAFSQMDLAATATDYQKVITAYDVTESGVADCWYLSFDGVDDGMATGAIDFSVSDEMSVFVGVLRTTTGVLGMICELSPTRDSNIGSFDVRANSDSTISSLSHGAATANAGQNAGTGALTAATAYTISVKADISGDLTKIRLDGVTTGTAIGDQGAGNYGAAYPFYIGRRGGSSLPLNGNIYSMIIRGALTADGTLARTEAFVAGKTGVTL